MNKWHLVRQWLVLQAVVVWQGGFFFYSAVVVPSGTDQIGALGQGIITRHVTEWMNLIGILALLLMGWDQWATGRSRLRWVCWGIMTANLAAMFLLHPAMSRQVDGVTDEGVADFDTFYLLHRWYLAAATVVWGGGLLWSALTLWTWGTAPAQARGTDKAPYTGAGTESASDSM